MHDIDKTRAEYVAQLEEQVRHLKTELARYKPIAQKWEPVGSSRMTQGGAEITLQFGGKQTTVSIASEVLLSTDLTSLTSSVVDMVCSDLAGDRLRPTIQHEVERMINAAHATRGASTSW